MAARTRKIRHDNETRLKIKVSQLLNRLKKHAHGTLDLQPTQIRAIEILLKKVLPDLQSTTIEGGEKPLMIERIERSIIEAKARSVNGHDKAHDSDSQSLSASPETSEI